MATTVYDVQELILDDGSTVTCKPASIKVMRKGQELMTTLGEVDEKLNDEEKEQVGLHKFLDLVALCLKRQRPEFVTEDGKTNYDLMEELFDYETMFRVIHVFLGVNFADPKLLEAAAELAAAQTQKDEKEQAGQS